MAYLNGLKIEFLQPIADMGLQVKAIISDKQRGLLPAVKVAFAVVLKNGISKRMKAKRPSSA